MNIATMKKAELVALCDELGLDSEGTVADLRALLTDHKDEWPDHADTILEAVEDDSPKVSTGNLGLPSTDPEAHTESDFLDLAYNACLGRDPDAAGKKHYMTNLIMRGITREDVIQDLLESDEGKALR